METKTLLIVGGVAIAGFAIYEILKGGSSSTAQSASLAPAQTVSGAPQAGSTTSTPQSNSISPTSTPTTTNTTTPTQSSSLFPTISPTQSSGGIGYVGGSLSYTPTYYAPVYAPTTNTNTSTSTTSTYTYAPVSTYAPTMQNTYTYSPTTNSSLTNANQYTTNRQTSYQTSGAFSGLNTQSQVGSGLLGGLFKGI